MAASKTILTISTNEGSSPVDIYFNKLEWDYDKQLIILDQPVAGGSGSHSEATTLLIDLGRLKQVISLTSGWLIDETSSSAYSKITTLQTLAERKGQLKIQWKIDDAGSSTTITKNGNIIKYKITEVPGRIGDTTQVLDGTQTKMFMINIQFAVGSHKG